MARAWLETHLDWRQRRRRLRRFARRVTQTLGRPWRRLRRRFWPGAPSSLLLLLVVAALIPAAALLPPAFGAPYERVDHLCGENEFLCGLGIHVLGTGVVGVLAYYFVFLRREAKAAGNARSRARRRPEQLFSWLAPRTDVSGIIGRQRLVTELARGLDDAPGPQLIVGDTGSGKTMVLLSLTKLLAKQGQVAVPISLRDADRSLDFEEQARQAFVSQIKAEVRSSEEADKVWRWLRRKQVVTVLADNLEKANVTPAGKVRALEVARSDQLRLAVASRTDGVPSNLEESVIELEPLNEKDVIKHLAECLKKAPGWRAKRLDEAEGEIGPIVRRAEIGDIPYYIGVVARLAEKDALPRELGDTTTEARRVLLDAYREALIERTLLPDAGLSIDERTRVLDALEVVAYARLRGAKDEAALRATVKELESQGGKLFDVRLTVEDGKRLRLLEVQDDGEIRFGHPTTLAYFAARFLSAHKADQTLWRRLIDKTPAARTLSLAIVLANAEAHDPVFAKATCEALVDQAKDPDLKTDADSEGSERLSLIAAAAEAAAAAELHKRPDQITAASRWRFPRRARQSVVDAITEGARRERPKAGLLAKLGAIPALSVLGTASAYCALWEYASADEDYAVRREATRALVDGRVPAFHAIEGTIGECLLEVESLPVGTKLTSDGHSNLADRLKVLGWTLPSMRTAFASGSGGANDVLVDFMSRLEKINEVHVDTQRGLEAAIAQGLKLDAMREPRAEVDPLALRLLDPNEDGRARFWFSRVLLVQAVARRCVEGAVNRRARDLVESAEHDDHPYVREAARLCQRALSKLGGGDWSRYIWEDLTDVVRRTPHGLAIEMTQLVADIVIALNLNEQREDELRETFCGTAKLPYCLGFSKNRAELLGTRDGPSWCVFGADGDGGRCQLCPYEFSINRPARRELSKAFCRHQRLVARPLRWHPRMSTSALKEFWREMEIRARM